MPNTEIFQEKTGASKYQRVYALWLTVRICRHVLNTFSKKEVSGIIDNMTETLDGFGLQVWTGKKDTATMRKELFAIIREILR